MTPLDRALVAMFAQPRCVEIVIPAPLDPLRMNASTARSCCHARRAAIALTLLASICAGAAADALFVSLFGVASHVTPERRPGVTAAAKRQAGTFSTAQREGAQ